MVSVQSSGAQSLFESPCSYFEDVIFFVFFSNFFSIKFGDLEEDTIRNVDLWSEVTRTMFAEEFFTSFGREAFQSLRKSGGFFLQETIKRKRGKINGKKSVNR